MAPNGKSEREILAQALAPGKDCPPIERLEAGVDADAVPQDLAKHLESCAYCRTELALMRSFYTATPHDTEEAAAVALVNARLTSPRIAVASTAEPWWKTMLQVRWLSPAAVVAAGMLVAVAVGVQWRNSSAPHLHGPSQPEQDVLRSGALNVIAPSGDVTAVPSQIQWQVVQHAAGYQVQLLEVDHTELWQAISLDGKIELPAQVKSKIVPAKTILVHVTALDSAGRKLAESEFVRFRLLQEVYKH
jgi:hypothetical protein